MDEQMAQSQPEQGPTMDEIKVRLADLEGLRTYRAKHWSELTDPEKIERMRSQVKYMNGTIRQIQDAVDRLTSVFPQHQHGPNGEILVRAAESGCSVARRYELIPDGKDEGDDVYF